MQIHESIQRDLDQLVEEYRSRCLWFLRSDFLPRTSGEALIVLRHIENHGDLAAFQRAAAIRQRLTRPSSERS